MTDLRARFIGGMSHAAATVNVVTTDGAAGRAGVTVSAMSSVSADTPKPTLLVCVHHQSPAAAKIVENGAFCVNVLRDDQSFISDTFAGRFKADVEDKFDCAEWLDGPTGAPRVADALVAFDCKVLSGERTGTHHIFVGAVEEVFTARRGSPLIYANRAYGRAARIEPVDSIAAGLRIGRETLRIGCYQTFGPFILPEMIEKIGARPDFGMTLIEGDHRRVLESLKSGETDLALIYDFDLGDDIVTETLNEFHPHALLAANHPLAAQDEVSLAELAEHPMVLFDSPPSADYFLAPFFERGLEPFIRHRSAQVEMVRGLVARGLGFSLLATRPAGDLSYDGRPLAIRPLTDQVAPSRLVLASRRGAELPAAAEAFAFLCREMFEHEI